MWVTGRQHSHRSPGRAPTRASEARAECRSAAALSSTPFGTAVDPDVPTTTAVPSATPFSWPERPVVTPSGPSTLPGASAATSASSRDDGSRASSGAMACSLPSSAAASTSSSRGPGRSTRTACSLRERGGVWGLGRPPGLTERFVTIVKVSSRTYRRLRVTECQPSSTERAAAARPSPHRGSLRAL